MATSSKRSSSSKQTNRAPKARVIAVKRTDVLPRKGIASAERQDSIVEPALIAPVVDAVPGTTPSKRPRRPHREASATVAKKAGPARGVSARSKKPLAPDVSASAEIAALDAPAVDQAATETELVVESSAILEETMIPEPGPALAVDCSAPESATIAPSPAPTLSAHHQAKTSRGTVVSWLLSALERWTGARR